MLPFVSRNMLKTEFSVISVNPPFIQNILQCEVYARHVLQFSIISVINNCLFPDAEQG